MIKLTLAVKINLGNEILLKLALGIKKICINNNYAALPKKRNL
jgi:hypothetical protein